MRLLNWLSQGQTGGVNKPLLRTRLTLNSLDERIVPDGGATNPPDPPPGQQGEPPQLGYGQTELFAHIGDYDIYGTNDSAGVNWLTMIDTVNGGFISVPLDYDPSQVVIPAAATAGYLPDSTKWCLIWDMDTGTWTGVPPGVQNLPVGRGMLDENVNVIYTSTSAEFAPVPRKPGILIGGIRFEQIPGGMVITDPFGNRIIIMEGGSGDGPVWKIEIRPIGGVDPIKKNMPRLLPTPEPPLAPPFRKPPVMITSTGVTVGDMIVS